MFEAASAEQQILRGQFTIVKTHLIEVLATHAVKFPRNLETRSSLFDKHAADSGGARLAVNAREDDQRVRILGAADQCLDAIKPYGRTANLGIGRVVSDIGAGMRLGHTNRENALSGADGRQQSAFYRFGRIGSDDPGLGADFAEHGHRGDIAALGNFFEDQCGIEDGKLRSAILFGDRHPKNAEFGEPVDVFPRKSAVHIGKAAVALRHPPDSADELSLGFGQLPAEFYRSVFFAHFLSSL